MTQDSNFMKFNYLLIFSIFISLQVYTQDFSEFWEGHYSYFNTVDVVQGDGKVFTASENAVFIYDTSTFEIETVTTVNGLSGEYISTLHYSEVFDLLVIGYENGLIEIYNTNDEDVLTVVDIVDKPTIPPDNKRINHFNEYNNFIYISTDYGISVYDLQRLEFGDTYFIGNGGNQIIVTQTAVQGDYIYASCRSGSGIRRALVASDDLIDFQEWSRIIVGNYMGIQSVEDKLYAIRLNRTIYEVDDATFSELLVYIDNPLDLKESNNQLVVTTNKDVFVYDSDFNLLANVQINAINYDTSFTCGVTTSEGIYIGTEDFGVLRTTPANPLEVEEIRPDGPLRNDTFSIQTGFGNLWASYGDYTFTYNPAPGRRYGVSHLVDNEWVNIKYDTIFNAVNAEVLNLNAISINPADPQQVFVSSFQSGILEINNDEPSVLYNQLNSGLESAVVPSNPSIITIRVSGTTFDQNGLLWSMTARVDRPLKSFDPASGQWRRFDFTDIIPDGLTDEFGFSDIITDLNGNLWIGGLNSGLIGFNENGGNQLLKNIFDEAQANLPSFGVEALALDNRNQLWIGTTRGLRVLFNTSNFFTDDAIRTNAIIILEDGIPKELLEQQFISDIKVDGGNNKWIATIGSGLFFFSPNGQETIYHFTKDNSPLPSNNVVEVSIDENSGVVYIATDRGLLSFKGGGSSPKETLDDAFVFPNPVRPNYDIFNKKVKIKDISENCNIKITDIEGNLVAEAETNTNLRFKGYNLEIDGGIAFWNGKNLSNNIVSSGVYLVMISDLDTFETKVLKLMVVR